VGVLLDAPAESARCQAESGACRVGGDRGAAGERFFLCTQNVDSLHEQAGALRVQHIHGEMKTKCDSCARTPFADESTYDEGVTLPQCDCGGTLRVSVVWFGEMVSGMERVPFLGHFHPAEAGCPRGNPSVRCEIALMWSET
jgi:NAD-dependent deacetylase